MMLCEYIVMVIVEFFFVGMFSGIVKCEFWGVLVCVVKLFVDLDELVNL